MNYPKVNPRVDAMTIAISIGIGIAIGNSGISIAWKKTMRVLWRTFFGSVHSGQVRPSPGCSSDVEHNAFQPIDVLAPS